MTSLFTKEKSMAKAVFWRDENVREVVAQELQKGNVVLGDSDTVLGLYARASQEGFDSLNKCKGRAEKPYLLLASTVDEVLSLIATPTASLVCLMESCWPGPLTLICKPRLGLPVYLKGRGGESIALRIPDHEGLRCLLAQTGPLFSTSANKTGESVPDSLEKIDPTILDSVGLCVLNESRSVISSTILDCTVEPIKLVREGAYPLSLIRARTGMVIE